MRSYQVTDLCDQPDDVIAPEVASLAEHTGQELDVPEVLPCDRTQSFDDNESAEVQSAERNTEDQGKRVLSTTANASIESSQLHVER
jgi:hypothetical protein